MREAALKPATVTPASLASWLGQFTCRAPASADSGPGYQQFLARELEVELGRWLLDELGTRTNSKRYSPQLRESADIAVSYGDADRLFVEIEFRPNFEKDLVKFQIGYNVGNLTAAVLIVALRRQHINPRYHTMPDYAKVKRTVDALRPAYPLMLIGIDGTHTDLTRPVRPGYTP